MEEGTAKNHPNPPEAKPSAADILKKNLSSNNRKPTKIWSNIFLDLVDEKGLRVNHPGFHKGHGKLFLESLGIKKEEITHAGIRPGQMHISLKNQVDMINRFNKTKNLFRLLELSNKDKPLFLKIRNLDQLREKYNNTPTKVKILGARVFVSKSQLEKWISKFGKIVSIKEAEQTFSKKEKEDPSVLEFFRESKSDDVIIEYIQKEGLNLPNILPIEGKRIIVVTNKKHRQCAKCFQKGHAISECKNDKVPLKDYKNNLIKFINQHSNKTNHIDVEEDYEEEELLVEDEITLADPSSSNSLFKLSKVEETPQRQLMGDTQRTCQTPMTPNYVTTPQKHLDSNSVTPNPTQINMGEKEIDNKKLPNHEERKGKRRRQESPIENQDKKSSAQTKVVDYFDPADKTNPIHV